MLNGMKPLPRSLRWGMVGGGGTSQIGYSHRCAALRDNVFTLLAGALDIDAERGRQFGEQLGIAPERCYADYQTLFAEEAKRPDGIEAVSVTTPTQCGKSPKRSEKPPPFISTNIKFKAMGENFIHNPIR